ncbi:hypothetical protein KIF59_13800 [Enterobacter cloacae subsp. cloacae]|nr:hypothetical protein [Enterobacter cloacae subsp. cloacae]
MLSRAFLALLTTFTLVGCDNSDDKPQAAARGIYSNYTKSGGKARR